MPSAIGTVTPFVPSPVPQGKSREKAEQLNGASAPPTTAKKLVLFVNSQNRPLHKQALIELNTDFSTKSLASQDIQAIVGAWQAGAISRDTMTELFRRGEVLPEGRSMEEELKLISEGTPPTAAKNQVLVVNSQN